MSCTVFLRHQTALVLYIPVKLHNSTVFFHQLVEKLPTVCFPTSYFRSIKSGNGDESFPVIHHPLQNVDSGLHPLWFFWPLCCSCCSFDSAKVFRNEVPHPLTWNNQISEWPKSVFASTAVLFDINVTFFFYFRMYVNLRPSCICSIRIASR